ncbi:HD domain-containing protein [Novosphingobium sp. Fuku2-ISO-50]|uniref:HD domain-containing protein n=1 Tax=Novosphingobium sp. Fuku2-ISO-50 TaxID=1739114 RepID=UPI00076C4B88|nr:HD domain-containing protein [Novosphingobium sp. Fuku2-ISO-50]KUR81027.1 metal-dependent phosphohydrolase [Novosphingobium sp. Fuku2-ISO-50]
MNPRCKPLAVIIAALVLSPPAGAQTPPDWRAGLVAFAKAHFRHPAWGWQHSRRDYDLARDLARADHVAIDDDVLFAAAYAHDIAAFVPWEDKDPSHDHSDVGADALGPVLTGLGFPAAKLGAVRDATRTHMYYRHAASPEAVYLHDADALDWLGAIGVARILATVEHGNPPPATPDPDAAPDLTAALATIEQNLKDVPGGVQSPAARARVPALVAEAQAFIDRLRAESEGGGAL